MLKIADWAKEDRPREKLILKGKNTLSSAELLAILIRSGTSSHSAIDIAKLILKSVNNDIDQLAKLTVNDYKKFRGIGEAKAISIISALELGRRRIPTHNDSKIISSSQVYQHMKPYLLDKANEEFWIVLLNQANKVLQTQCISSGGVTQTTVDPKLIWKTAIDHLACQIILVHNHPSGNPNPSHCDIQLTQKIKKGAVFFDIQLLDHIIFTNNNYFSFADKHIL